MRGRMFLCVKKVPVHDSAKLYCSIDYEIVHLSINITYFATIAATIDIAGYPPYLQY